MISNGNILDMAGDVPGRSRRGNTASVKRTKDAISDTVASYAISDEQGAKEKRSGQPATNRSKPEAAMARKIPLSFYWSV
jgi:hypothetical protein